VQIHANLKSQTVEELEGQKRDLHLTTFRYTVAEIARDLERIAREEGAHERLERDASRFHEGESYTVEKLLLKIVVDCKAALKRHEDTPLERYADDFAYRTLVAEMLQV
jgi:hypothetical protein